MSLNDKIDKLYDNYRTVHKVITKSYQAYLNIRSVYQDVKAVMEKYKTPKNPQK
jgi:hypothetical protein